MHIDLTGRTALVTGGSRGLGLATAARMARSGAKVAILARDLTGLRDAERQLRDVAEDRPVLAVQADVCDAGQLRVAHDTVVAALGPVDILVNNAGQRALAPFVAITDEMWEADLQLKLMASVRLTRLVWPSMCERRWGRVINVLNTYARAPTPGSAPTSVTRAAQLALTKVLAGEGAPHNVLVNALLVGLIRSSQLATVHRETAPDRPMDEYIQDRVRGLRIPMDRIGEADEFASIACFLASDCASYVTGAAINVDGGMSPVA